MRLHRVTAIIALFAIPFLSVTGRAYSETLSDYAKSKNACSFHCDARTSLRLNLPADLLPNKGAILAYGSFLSTSAYWKIVDFEKNLAIVLRTNTVRRPDGALGAPTVDDKREVLLNEQQLSAGIVAANEVWNPPPPVPTPSRDVTGSPRPPPVPCFDATNDLIFLDGDQMLEAHSSCGFASDVVRGFNIEARKFETWFDSVMPPLRRVNPNGG